MFHLLFDSVAAAVRAACPGVALGDGPNAPRITLLLYADDLVSLADNPSDLQNALTAVGGPDKTVVLVVGSRMTNFRFDLHSALVPCASLLCCCF